MAATQRFPKRRTVQVNLSSKETQRLAAEAANRPQDVALPKNAGHLLQEIAAESRELNQLLQRIGERLEFLEQGEAFEEEVMQALQLCRSIQMDAMQGSYQHMPAEKQAWEISSWTRMLLEQLQTILPPGALTWEFSAAEYETKIPRRLWLSALQRSILQAAELQGENGLEIFVRLRDTDRRTARTRVMLEILDHGREVSQTEMEMRLTDGAGGNPERADGFHLLLLLAKELDGDLEITSDADAGTCRRLIVPLKKLRVI